MLNKLIKISSITGNEQEIQKYVSNLLTTFDFKPLEFKGNVLVVIKGSNRHNCLIFNSHVDTVTPGNVELWRSNPFEPLEKGGRVYGLGASDNKSSVAALLMLAKKLSVEKPACDVILTFTIGEEADGHGTSDVVKLLTSKYLKVYKNISAIVCEPTGLKEISVAHKGNIFLSITTKGKTRHGSDPITHKEHSVFKMYEIVKKLEILSKKWAKGYKNKLLGVPTIGLVTSIGAGNLFTPNKFPDSCTASFDIRTVPEMHTIAFEEIGDLVGDLGVVKYLYPPVGFAYTNIDSDIVKIFKKELKVKITTFSGSSDAPFFTKQNIPTIIFGPGEASLMHKPNEYCYENKVMNCVVIFKKVIREFARI